MPVSSTVMAMRTSSDSGAPSPAPSGSTADGDQHAARVGELDGVADQVGEDLAQPHLVAQQQDRQSRIDRPGDVDALLVGLRRQQLDDALHAFADRQRRALQLQLVGLDLGEVEDLVDQREQRARRSLDGLGVGLLLRRQLGVAQQRGHAENAVHRRADLVAHRRQEARLGAVGRFRLQARLAQLGLGLAPLGDVAAEALHLRHGSVGRRHDMLLPFEPARPGARLDLLHVALLATREARSERHDHRRRPARSARTPGPGHPGARPRTPGRRPG